jgi:hypothetical protein
MPSDATTRRVWSKSRAAMHLAQRREQSMDGALAQAERVASVTTERRTRAI